MCASHGPAMWRSIEIQSSAGAKVQDLEIELELEKMCCRAVERSQSQLTHLKLHSFGSDSLLAFISHRCDQLRQLQLVYSFAVTDNGLIEAVKNLPSLEELHLYYFPIKAETIKSIGRFCPQLNTFKFNQRWIKMPPLSYNLVALAIVEAMPELRHLQVLGNGMTNEGLQAIVDRCPHLESLDLRQCFNVHLCGNLGRLCSQRIQCLRCPHDSTDDYYGFAAEIIISYDVDDDSTTDSSDVDMVSDYDYDDIPMMETFLDSEDDFNGDDWDDE